MMNELELTRILLGNNVTAPYFCGVISHDELYRPAPKPDSMYAIQMYQLDLESIGLHWHGFKERRLSFSTRLQINVALQHRL